MAVTLETMKATLTESTTILCDNLRLEDGLLRTLKTEMAITNDHATTITSKITEPAKVEELLNILMRSPVTSYEAFMNALEKDRKDIYSQVKAIQDKRCDSTSVQAPAATTTASQPPQTLPGHAGDKVSDQDIRTITHKSGLTRNQFKNLYKELGLKDNEVENSERNADTTDVQLQADKVLHDWRAMKGNDATKGAILKAMKEYDQLKEPMDSLMDKWKILNI